MRNFHWTPARMVLSALCLFCFGLAGATSTVAAQTSESISEKAWAALAEAIAANGGLVRIVTEHENGHVIGVDASNYTRVQPLDEKDLKQVWVVSGSGSTYTFRNLITGQYMNRASGAVTQFRTTGSALTHYVKLSANATSDKPLFNFVANNGSGAKVCVLGIDCC